MTHRKPILVTGAHRSGTTFVGKMLSLASFTTFIHEPFNLDLGGIFRYVCDENEHNMCNIIHSGFYQYIDEAIRFSYSSYYHQYKISTRNSGKLPLKKVLTVSRDYARLFPQRFLTPLVKDPIAVFSAEWLASRFDMDVVVLIRHPAAFASSLKKLNLTYDLTSFLEQELLLRDYLHPFEDEINECIKTEPDIIDQSILLWKMIYHVISLYQKKHPNWLFVRHEDVSQDSAHHFEYLFQKLNLNLTEKISKTIREYTQSPRKTLESSYKVTRRDSKSEILKWKKTLSGAEIDRIRENLIDIWNKFYSEDDW
ncbi:MAG: hypothetical protein GY832_07280 [Chloroflexi bacterium]|nr:hypothetical protein [Chloroflexota bacterium]